MISLATAIQFCQQFEPALVEHGFHCGLTGSTLFKGESKKDIDVIIYPHKCNKPGGNLNPWQLLTALGFTEDSVYEIDAGYNDKRLFVVSVNGMRVDLFFLTTI